MTAASFEDFYKVPDIEFDIVRLRNDLNKILNSKKFNNNLVFSKFSSKRFPNEDEIKYWIKT